MLSEREKALLSGPNFLYIATVNEDGSPQVSPVWVEVEDDLVVINTARGRVKERNMSRNSTWHSPYTTKLIRTMSSRLPVRWSK